jgi:hypothetical protein
VVSRLFSLVSFFAMALVGIARVAMVFFVVCLLAEAAYRAAATRFLLSCQKKPGKEKARLAGGWSGGTHCALAALRSNSRRKYEGQPEGWGATLARAWEHYAICTLRRLCCL